MKLNAVLETALYADDLEAAFEFYANVLGLELHARGEGRHLFFRCGAAMLLIFNPAATEVCEPDGVPCHGSRGAGHVAWAVAAGDFEAWRQRLARAGVAIEHEQEWPNGARSIYFRDPAGNSLELATPSLWARPGFDQ